MYQQHNFAHQHALSSPPQNQHYPQSVTGFNQPTHFAGVQGYPGASPPNALYASQSPSMQGDPNTFAHMFKSHLAALTFNSKPIINQVTILAHENASQMAPVVAQCLEEHILTVRAICACVTGTMYADHFNSTTPPTLFELSKRII